MTKYRQTEKQQALREVEGYLELLHCPVSTTRLSRELREPLAQRSLDVLDRVADYGPWSAHAYFLRGQALRAMDRYAEAVEALRTASTINGKNRHIWLALAWCCKRCQRIDLAIEALEEALLIAPDTAILHYNLACYWSLARNVPQAVVYLSRAFELNPLYRDQVASEPDFDPIRNHPYFQTITSAIV